MGFAKLLVGLTTAVSDATVRDGSDRLKHSCGELNLDKSSLWAGGFVISVNLGAQPENWRAGTEIAFTFDRNVSVGKYWGGSLVGTIDSNQGVESVTLVLVTDSATPVLGLQGVGDLEDVSQSVVLSCKDAPYPAPPRLPPHYPPSLPLVPCVGSGAICTQSSSCCTTR